MVKDGMIETEFMERIQLMVKTRGRPVLLKL